MTIGPGTATARARIGLALTAAAWAYYQLLAVVIAQIWPSAMSRTPTGWHWMFKVYGHQDAGYFARIAQFGYLSRGPDDLNVAFFPGYPLSARYFADLAGLGRTTGLERAAALSVVAWAGTAVAAVLMWRYVVERTGQPRSATVAVAYLLGGAYSVFLVAPYSEGPFLALSLGAWLCARRDRWISAGLLCAAATLVRVNGLFLAAALFVMYVQHLRREPWRGRARDLALLVGAPAAALAGFVGWQRIATGRWDAWFRAEARGWYRHTDWPWHTFTVSVAHFRSSGDAHAYFQTGMELFFAAAYVLALIVLTRRRWWPELTYVGLTAAALLTSSFYQSVPRSMLVCFPVTALVAHWMSTTRRRWAAIAVAVGAAAIGVADSAQLVCGYFAG